MSIEFNLNRTSNVLREINGVGNGPVTGYFNNNKIKEFKDAGISYSRLHDTEGVYGSGEFVNIHCVFPNFDADVNNPDSYNFECTDLYLNYILEAGTKVYYRLGETIENHEQLVARYIHPPKDMQKWAEICEHIIMHYNEGWANGYHMGIEYWEIWNEPDNPSMWTGSPEQFYELYRITANHLKNRFPHLKIGGYGASGFYSAFREDYSKGAMDDWLQTLIPFAHGFFKYISAPETKAPLDFFSWHYYTNDVSEISWFTEYVRDILNKHGFSDAEIHLNEWNYNDLIGGGKVKGSYRRSMPCAAFVASAFCAIHDAGIDKAMYYDAEVRRGSYCGLFENGNPQPQKPYYVFLAYKALMDLKYDSGCLMDHQNRVYALSASDGSDFAVMVTNTGYKSQIINLDLGDELCNKEVEIYLLSEDKNLELIETKSVCKTFEFLCTTNSVVLVKSK